VKLVRVLWFILLLASAVLATSASAALADTSVNVSATPGVTAPTVTASNATNITSISAVLHGNITNTGGETYTLRGFEWGYATGNYTSSWNETSNFEVGAFSHQVGLNACSQIFWRAIAVNGVGQGNSTELNFWTLCTPEAPTDFTITRTGGSSINITWTIGSGATTTVIVAGDDGCPTGITDGYIVYNGTGNWTTVEGLSLSLTNYCYHAYSWNSYGYSPDYAEDSIGGETMVYTIIGIISLGAMIAGFALSQLLILICAGIGWVAFGFLIYNTAPSNLGAALLILGIAFALVCFVWPLALAVRRRRGRPSYEDQDYKNYEEQVRNITRR
jgi:hypothetical protein